MLHDDVPIRDAATVMPIRDGAGGLEVLMVRRTASAAFAAGAWVFPGGAIDEDDTVAVERGLVTGRDPGSASDAVGSATGLGFWVAAARETFEESGILIPGGSQAYERLDEPDRIRRSVAAGEQSFSSLLSGLDAVVDAGRIAFVSRWVTPKGETRRFDTRFFLVEAPGGQEPLHDEDETTEAAWTLPAEALRRSRAGEIFLLPPTVANLEWLSGFTTAADAIEAGLGLDVEIVRPDIIVGDDGSIVLHIRDDTILLRPPTSGE